MDAGLAATLSESYGYVAAEHVLLGVPVVTGPGVACLPRGELTVTDPGDPRALAAALLKAVGQAQTLRTASGPSSWRGPGRTRRRPGPESPRLSGSSGAAARRDPEGLPEFVPD